MSEKLDRRKARTREQLRKALIEIMEEKGPDRVTVSDLTEKANINRSTFYLHYTDAVDLLSQVKGEVWEGLRSRMEKLNPYEYLSYAARSEPDPAMVNVIEYYAEHADFFRVILGPKGDPAFAVQIKEFLQTQHISKILDLRPDLAETIVPKDFMIAYFAASNLSILLHWIESGMQQSPSSIALMITHILGSAVRQLYGIEAGKV
ncbi:TetR/AcrR family transcriptional regulator [Paenibacillus lautus]|nr:TetR/AcrR family transcriptional regulator [Paenibacillus lautus]MDL1163474.1 TetR/AcrR family transcriptional regulator [Yersinia pestis]MEC0254205.1 TetR/AcrR family transcriptional regulator [Paenibacillus lautus]